MPDLGTSTNPDSPVRATTAGCVGGTDLEEATRVLRGELGGAHLVPLAAASGLPGTTALTCAVAQLRHLPVSLTPHGWRLTGSRAGDDLATRRARSQYDSLLGITADVLAGQPAGPTVARIAGPATLASRLALPSGEPVAADAAAVRDVAQAWAEAMAAFAARIESSLPGAQVVLDVVEPDLEPVTSGRVRSSSGYRLLPAWDLSEVGAAWTSLAAATRVILPVEAAGLADVTRLLRAEAAARDAEGDSVGEEPSAAPRIAVRMTLPESPEGYTPVAAWVEAGHHVVVQVPTPTAAPKRISRLAAAVATPWRRLGLTAAQLDRVVLATGETTAAGSPDVGPGTLRFQAATARDGADALDVVRHDDLDAIS